MLYNLTFQTNNLTLPLAHQTKVQGMIYALMSASPEYSHFLHDSGYSASGGSNFKLFTYGNLSGAHTIQQGMIVFHKQVSFALRTADPFLGSLLHEVLRPGLVCTLGGQQMVLSDVQLETLHLEQDCRQLKIRMLSPITVFCKTEAGKTRYFNPLEDEFSARINDNYQNKWLSATGEPAKDSVELIALSVGRPDKTVTKIKGTIVNAWGGTYLLKGSPTALEFLYHTGLGAKNSMGFGVFEIISW